MKRTLAILALVCFSACASRYTVLDRASLQVSDNSRVTADSILPNVTAYPAVAQQLALAEEVYDRQLVLLKDRRNDVRARRRYLNVLSYITLSTTALGVGGGAIAASGAPSDGRLKAIGYGALGGLALGTVLQLAGAMQEDPQAVDDKIAHLEESHNAMIDQLRTLLGEAPASQPAGQAASKASVELRSQMGIVIEGFIDQALDINVKG